MLRNKEKKEYLHDGLSPDRQKAFRAARKLSSLGLSTLDEYIEFLSSIQEVYPSAARAQQKSTAVFKL